MIALLGEAEQHGATLPLQSPVERIRVVPDDLHLLCGDEAATRLRARWVINTAALGAVALANCTEGLPLEHVPKAYFAKGSYCSLGGVARLVNPVPEPGGLRVHHT